MGDDPILGLSDLATACPSVAAEWHPEKNGGLAPERVRAGSLRPVWWLGACGHEWDGRVFDRARAKGCPYCSGKRVLAGFNDLSTTHPDLAAQWHPEKNGALSPSGVTAGSNKGAWWVCAHGHEWEARISSRADGIGCPYCSGRRPVPGERDLATLLPDVAALWHPTRNGSLAPDAVGPGSSRKVWWLGECGHEWQARVSGRVRSKGLSCPSSNMRAAGVGASRAVRCVETGAAYPCAADAAAAMGLKSRQSISQACRKPGATAAGFHWEYA